MKGQGGREKKKSADVMMSGSVEGLPQAVTAPPWPSLRLFEEWSVICMQQQCVHLFIALSRHIQGVHVPGLDEPFLSLRKTEVKLLYQCMTRALFLKTPGEESYEKGKK